MTSIFPELVKSALLEKTTFLVSREKSCFGTASCNNNINEDHLVEDTIATLNRDKTGVFVLKLSYIKFIGSASDRIKHRLHDTDIISKYVVKQKTEGLMSFFGDNFLWDKTKNYYFNFKLLSEFGSNGGVSKRRHVVSKGTTKRSQKPFKNASSSFPDYFEDAGMSVGYSSNFKNYGKERGSFIHKELEDFVKHGPNFFSKIHDNPEPMTFYIMNALSKAGYVGLCAEYPIWFSIPNKNVERGSFLEKTKLILASAIDLICWDTINKRIVLLEVKTGYDHGRFYHRFVSKEELLLAKRSLNDKRVVHQLYFVNNTQNLSKKKACETSYRQGGGGGGIRGGQVSSLPTMGFMLKSLSCMQDCPVTRAKIQLCMYLHYFRKILGVECIGQVLHCQSDGTVEFFTIEDGWYHKYTNLVLHELQKL